MRTWYVMVVTTVALAAGAALAQDEGMDGAALEDAEGPVRKPPRVWYRPSAATPGEQLALVRDLEARGRLAVAGRRCEALVRTWPDSPEAVVAQQLRAEMLGRDGQFINAFEEYQYLIDFYANRFDFAEVIEAQFQLAREVMNRRRHVLWMWSYTSPRRALPLFRQIVSNAPSGPRTAEIHFTVGWIEQDSGNWIEAISAFEWVQQRWGDSEFAASASYGRATSLARLADRNLRDEVAVRDALSALAQVLRDYPEAPEAEAATAERDRLSAHLAKLYYDRAAYYDRIARRPESAIIAYQDFLRQFPYSPQAEDVTVRIAELERVRDAEQPGSGVPATP